MANKQRRKRGLRSSRGGHRIKRSARTDAPQSAVEMELLANVSSDDASLRCSTVSVIAEKGLGDAVSEYGWANDVLLARLNDPSVEVRIAAIAGLEEFGDWREETVTALCMRLSVEHEPTVRERLEACKESLTSRNDRRSLSSTVVLPSNEGPFTKEEETEMEVGSNDPSLHPTSVGNIEVDADSQTARSRYLSELPDLLETNRGDWVAYTAHERIALHRDPQKVYRACCERGLKEGEFLLACIEPNVRTEIDI